MAKCQDFLNVCHLTMESRFTIHKMVKKNRAASFKQLIMIADYDRSNHEKKTFFNFEDV